MSKNQLSVIEFARKAGVHRQAIYNMLNKGQLVKMPNGKLNVLDPVNAFYLQSDHTAFNHKGGKKTVNKKKKAVKEQAGREDAPPAVSIAATDKQNADLRKRFEEIRKLQIHNEQKLDNLVSKDVVKKYFGGMASVIVNYIFPMGNRLAPRVAGLCKVTDPSVVMKIQAVMDKEITRALEQFKKACAEIDDKEED